MPRTSDCRGDAWWWFSDALFPMVEAVERMCNPYIWINRKWFRFITLHTSSYERCQLDMLACWPRSWLHICMLGHLYLSYTHYIKSAGNFEWHTKKGQPKESCQDVLPLLILCHTFPDKNTLRYVGDIHTYRRPILSADQSRNFDLQGNRRLRLYSGAEQSVSIVGKASCTKGVYNWNLVEMDRIFADW